MFSSAISNAFSSLARLTHPRSITSPRAWVVPFAAFAARHEQRGQQQFRRRHHELRELALLELAGGPPDCRRRQRGRGGPHQGGDQVFLRGGHPQRGDARRPRPHPQGAGLQQPSRQQVRVRFCSSLCIFFPVVRAGGSCQARCGSLFAGDPPQPALPPFLLPSLSHHHASSSHTRRHVHKTGPRLAQVSPPARLAAPRC